MISSKASSQEMRWKFSDDCGATGVPARVERRALARVPLRRHPPHGIQHAVRRVNPIQILCDLGAQEPARHRMRRIALNLDCATIFDGDQDTASIRTIMRTRGMDNFFHNVLIIRKAVVGRLSLVVGPATQAATLVNKKVEGFSARSAISAVKRG